MNHRLAAAALVLVLACILQFWLASAGFAADLILAALVAFAFFFEWIELAAFVLFGMFVLNWQPAVGPSLFLFGAIPFVAYAFRKLFTWAPWAGIPVMIVCGFALFYLAAAPGMFAAALPSLALDVAAGLVFGEFTLWALNRAEW